LLAANTLVQQLLSVIASDKKLLIPFTEARSIKVLLGLLVNPSVTELDCAVLDSNPQAGNFSDFLLKHALKNCPKISKIELTNHYRYNHEQMLPVERFKLSWNNLQSINSFDYMCNEKTVKLIQENFPNIESVILFYLERLANFFIFTRELSVAVVPRLTQAVVGHLVNMKRLHTLEFVEPSDYYSRDFNHDLFISVAGEVPSLRNFGFITRLDEHHNQFIEGLAEKYHQKELLVTSLKYVPIIYI
jgi:hypothetical protein